jgi:hypothetical protein
VTEFDLQARFVRGTGRFQAITGSWRERGQPSASGDSSAWEVEYTAR